MSPQIKRILLAILFVLAVGAVAYLLFVFFFRPAPVDEVPVADPSTNAGLPGQLPNVNQPLDTTNQQTGQNTPTDTGLPEIDTVANGGETLTTTLTPNVDAADPEVAQDGTVRYYDARDGQFYRVDTGGNIRQIGSAQFPNVESVEWAPTTDEAILEFPDGSNIYYDFLSDNQATLPKEYEDFTFSPSSDSIAFKYLHPDEERRVLATSNPDGSEARTLESLGANEDRVKVDWSPTGKVAAQYSEFIDLNRQNLGFIGLNKENFRGVVVSGSGLQTQYAPDGQRMLYSTYSSATDYQSTLAIVDADGENIGKNNQPLELRTSADKCAFSPDGASVYCGVPSENEFGSGLEPGVLDSVSDDLYRVDLQTGVSTKIATPVDANGNAQFRVSDLIVSQDSGELVFKDANTEELVTIDLR
jgi:hypothetical protein